MRVLTADDLLPLEEYAHRRREFFESLVRYLDRYRRVRIGPAVTLVFENRQTLWFRVQEIIRVARLSEPELVQQELDEYNRLLPCRNQLQAAFLIEVPDAAKLANELAPWQKLRGDELLFRAGSRTLPANLLTCRPADRAIGAAHWIQFDLDEDARRALCDFRQPARVELRTPSYQHQSPVLSDEVRQSLLDDLGMSDQD